jgi:hypothetical protein
MRVIVIGASPALLTALSQHQFDKSVEKIIAEPAETIMSLTGRLLSSIKVPVPIAPDVADPIKATRSYDHKVQRKLPGAAQAGRYIHRPVMR